jgi:hypothetical protein
LGLGGFAALAHLELYGTAASCSCSSVCSKCLTVLHDSHQLSLKNCTDPIARQLSRRLSFALLIPVEE